MKTALGLVALTIAGVASSPAYGLAEAGAPAAAGNLRHLDEAPPANAGGMENKLGDVPPGGYEGLEDGQWLESDPGAERWRGGGGDCWPGSWRWPGCRGGGGGGCWPGSWRWPACKYRRGPW